ncbi:MAG: hypothetical protein HDQ88_02400 [Clostridia bacterium]|nr:hypothetical protein [Clostridia bacterium]
MQLLIILAMLLYGGKSNPQALLKEVKPVLETFGGEEIKEALKSAEELSDMLSAVRGLTGATAEEEESTFTQHASPSPNNPAIAFPLAPISTVADKDITYCLSKYISEN